MSFASRFDEPGTLTRPGPVGRLVRLALGAACLTGVWSAVTNGPVAIVPKLPHPVDWIPIGIALWLIPAVVDIGWGVAWKRRSQWAVVSAGVVLSFVSWLSYGRFWAPPLGWFVLGFTAYTLAHLGLSFVLSAVLATPGCEMRAIPHLWTVVTGRATKEHYCPSPLDGLDQWELGRRRSDGA